MLQVNEYIVKRVHHSKTVVRIQQIAEDHAIGVNLRTGKECKIKLTDRFFKVTPGNLQFAKKYCNFPA